MSSLVPGLATPATPGLATVLKRTAAIPRLPFLRFIEIDARLSDSAEL